MKEKPKYKLETTFKKPTKRKKYKNSDYIYLSDHFNYITSCPLHYHTSYIIDSTSTSG